MRFVVHQLSALQGAAILAASARQARLWYLLEGDALGAANADRRAWLYEHMAASLVPGLMDRPEPQLEDYEPEIAPTRIEVIESSPRLVVVQEEPTAPATRFLRGGWFQEEDSQSA
jgi:hypothetical protein